MGQNDRGFARHQRAPERPTASRTPASRTPASRTPASRTPASRTPEPPPASAVLAEALFASDLQSSQQPSLVDIRSATRRTLGALDVAGCAGRVAQEFGDHPDAAVARMQWAKKAISLAYGEGFLSWPRDGRRRRVSGTSVCHGATGEVAPGGVASGAAA